MKTLVTALSLVFAGTAEAYTYGFGAVSFAGNTGLNGTATASIQVPGTFGGANPVDPTQGRYLKNATIWCDTPVAGDKLTTLEITDTDGVVPVPARAAFPNYPQIFNLLDSASGAESSIYIPPDGITLEAYDQLGSPAARFLPSQLYVKAVYQSAGLGIGKGFRIILRWGYWQ